MYIRIEIPLHTNVEEVRLEDVPGWDADDKRASRRFGDRWYDESRSLILLVPSLAAPGLARNVLIHQRHPDFGRVNASKVERVRCHPKLLAQ